MADSLLFLSGFDTGGHELRVVSISDSTAPYVLGSCWTRGVNFGVWANLPHQRSFVADKTRGLAVVDISNLHIPVLDTSLYAAGYSVDVCIDGSRAYVASDIYGMVILDISDPAQPHQLGAMDSTRQLDVHTVAARDSFAYMHFSVSLLDLRSIDVTDPRNPVSAGGYNVPAWPEDMELRDSLLYVAEMYHFQVVNVARPREPVLVGSCTAGDANSAGLSVRDTLAFIGNFMSQVVNISDPTNPAVVGTFIP